VLRASIIDYHTIDKLRLTKKDEPQHADKTEQAARDGIAGKSAQPKAFLAYFVIASVLRGTIELRICWLCFPPPAAEYLVSKCAIQWVVVFRHCIRDFIRACLIAGELGVA